MKQKNKIATYDLESRKLLAIVYTFIYVPVLISNTNIGMAVLIFVISVILIYKIHIKVLVYFETKLSSMIFTLFFLLGINVLLMVFVFHFILDIFFSLEENVLAFGIIFGSLPFIIAFLISSIIYVNSLEKVKKGIGVGNDSLYHYFQNKYSKK